MTEQTADMETEAVDIVAKVVCPHKGVAYALQRRAKQLHNTVYALKQYIHTLREASKTSIRGQKAALTFLELPSSLIAEAQPPAPGSPVENGLLANDGLRTLIEKLASCDRATEECIQELYDPDTAFSTSIEQLDKELEEINSLLHKNRLGKAHRQYEDKVCTAASDVNQAIQSLKTACFAPSTLSPYCDPYTLCRNTEHRMKSYLDMENEYAIQCLAEQKVEQLLEQNVFSIMEELPLEHEKIMSPMKDKCNLILAGAEEKVKSFHALSDWTAFESRNANDFTPEQVRLITITAENHPDEELFDQFQLIRLDDLEIYHRLRSQHSSRKQKSEASLETKFKRAREFLVERRRNYARRGVWSVSSGGYLIEYEHKSNTVLSMFNLRKCKLGSLAPDETRKLGYFILQGQKVHELPNKKKSRIKKYRFRAEWECASALYRVMSTYCTVASGKESKTEGRTDSMLSGDTTINVDG